MSRRGGQLTRVTLRLGLLFGGVVAGWCAYNAISGDAAYAADAPHVVTVDGTADRLPISLSPVIRPTATTESPEASTGSTSTSGDGGAATSTEPSQVRTLSQDGWGSHPDRATTPRTGKTTPGRPERPAATPPARTVPPGTAPTRSAGSAPVTPAPHPGATSGAGPVLNPERPAPGAASRPAEPPVPIPQPPVNTPAAPAVDDAAEPTVPDPAAAPIDSVPDASASTPAPAAPHLSFGLAIAPHHEHAAGAWSARHTNAVATRPVFDPIRSDVDPAPGIPTSSPGSVGTSSAGHSEAAETSAVNWTPPAVRGQRQRPAPAVDLPSRSPRPGTRPA